jgi:nardilysin
VSKHANYNRLLALCAQAFHVDTLLEELETMTLTDVTELVTAMLKSCHIEALVMGNVTRDEAASLAKAHAQAPLGTGCVAPASIRRRDQCVRLPAGSELMHKEDAKNPEDENCGVESYFQCTEAASFVDRAHVDMLDQIMSEPAYNQLRTKEQLGYTVYSGMRLTHGVLGFCFGVVSAKVTSEEADARIDAFISSTAQAHLDGLTEEEFAKQKVTLWID